MRDQETETCPGIYNRMSDEEMNNLVPKTYSVDGLQDEASICLSMQERYLLLMASCLLPL